MKATWLYRIAAVIFVLFSAGHTVGFLTFVPPTAEGQSVYAAMNSVNLQLPHANGGVYTYGGFYRGFGLFASVYLLLAAYLSWHLGTLVRKLPAALGALPWVFFASQLGTFAITWSYFPAGPTTFAGMSTLCLGAAALLAKSSKSNP
jgi:hypothetical protein